MQRVVFSPSFAGWRNRARQMLAAEIPPEEVVWEQEGEGADLLGIFEEPALSVPSGNNYRVSPEFMDRAKRVACFRALEKWALLYRLLWRLTHGEKHLLKIATDPDVSRMETMDREIRRDVHKMRAFVRFRKITQAEGEWFVAWFEPSHLIVKLNAKFFVDRFASMRWSILTPDECVHWSSEKLLFSPGVTKSEAPTGDDIEPMWRTYYQNIFNPARVKVHAMLNEMPKKYWHNLPEAADIPELLQQAPVRTQTMISDSEMKSSEEYGEPSVPETTQLEELRHAAAGCLACPWARHATQTVFGEGGIEVQIIFVGEQPGDSEDLAGRPFVGPAGQVLDRALAEVGIDRKLCYVTNAVKHFKFELRGRRRIHEKPSGRDIEACRPWIQAEMQALRPSTLVCLGATAVRAVFGREMPILKNRGQWMKSLFSDRTLITVHPSSILRAPDPIAQEKAYAAFVQDLGIVAEKVG